MADNNWLSENRHPRLWASLSPVAGGSPDTPARPKVSLTRGRIRPPATLPAGLETFGTKFASYPLNVIDIA